MKSELYQVEGVILPFELYKLARIVLEDAKLCEADPRFVLNMAQWVWRGHNACQVCMAGAVIVQTCKYPIDTIEIYDNVTLGDTIYSTQMMRIDELRMCTFEFSLLSKELDSFLIRNGDLNEWEKLVTILEEEEIMDFSQLKKWKV